MAFAGVWLTNAGGARETVIIVCLDRWMADFVCCFDDLIQIVGHFINLEVFLRKQSERHHFALIKLVEWAPKTFTI